MRKIKEKLKNLLRGKISDKFKKKVLPTKSPQNPSGEETKDQQ